MIYFKVKTGFEPNDFISIDETELHRAVIAQATGKIGIFKEGTVAGNNIISIKEDWSRMMGYNRGYELNDENYNDIPRKLKEEARTAYLRGSEEANAKLENRPIRQIEEPKNKGGGMKSLGDIIKDE